MAGIDDGHPAASGADQEARDLLDRLLRRREADAEQPIAAKRREALERERQMRLPRLFGAIA